MQKQIQTPSFLQVEGATEPFNHNKFLFQRVNVITLGDMVQQQVEHILQQTFINNHQKQLKTPIFVLQVSNSYKKWTLMKRFGDIVSFSQKLSQKYKNTLISWPIKNENKQQQKYLNLILELFEIYMNEIIKKNEIILDKIFLNFIQNYVSDDRKKIKIYKQIQLKKKAGGRYNQSKFTKMFCNLFNWSNRNFTITKQGFYYTRKIDSFDIQQVISFSNNFSLLYGEVQTNQTYGIIISSCHRTLEIDGANLYNMVQFIYALKKAMKQNQNISVHRFNSFARIRQKCTTKSYIDGQNYFNDLYYALISARNKIFITGWMLSPYFSLKRPDPNNQYRLDHVLEKIAKSGIKIHIIIYMQPKMALNIDSQFTQSYLSSLCSNIKVLRHPNYVLIPFLWSHHEKMVIIDQKIAFMGGLDIGYGRMDNNKHQLNDQNEIYWNGIDYCNYRITDILNPKQYKQSTINRKIIPRMPWHDISISIKGSSVLDLTRHFIQYWNYVNFQLNMDQRQLLIYAGINQNITELQQNNKNKDNIIQIQDKIIKNNINNNKIEIKQNLLKRKKFAMSTILNISQKQYIQKKQRSSQIYKLNLNQDLNNNKQQIQFYNIHLKQKNKIQFMDNFLKKINPTRLFNRQGINFNKLLPTIQSQMSNIQSNQSFKNRTHQHQLLRSASLWSLGLDTNNIQQSILIAYVELIYNSKEFIYIENQFFISVQNTISKAIKERIHRAYQRKQSFKFLIVIPSLPGFDGDIQDEKSAVFRIQIHHIYNTIFKSQDSILKQLSYIPNLHEYIQFYCLRQHGIIDGKPVTQIIYVHSKLMIVDDEIVLIGSANINDRSLLGSRDSQIAIIIKDTQRILINANTQKNILKKRQVSKFAHNLRTNLYIEHFNLNYNEVEDYLNNDIWYKIYEQANKNQILFRQIFGCYPDNEIQRFIDIKRIKQNAKIQKYQILSKQIKGHAIPFQEKFLNKENLQLTHLQKQYYVPKINFC